MGAPGPWSGSLLGLLSALRAWAPLVLRPVRSARSFLECCRSFDPDAWGEAADRFDDGVGLARRTVLPALLIALAGSLAPASGGGPGGATSGDLGGPVVAALAPFASAAHSGLAGPTSAGGVSSTGTVDTSYLLRLGVLSLLSPAAVDAARRVGPPLGRVRRRLRDVLRARKRADDGALAELRRRAASGRALRRLGYDLYLPPKEEEEDGDRAAPPLRALLLLPGFGIDHAAYSEVASRISDAGLAVAVASLEPLRLAHGSTGAGMGDVERIARAAGADVCRRVRGIGRGRGADPSGTATVVEFSLAGHSMGGYAALRLASELARSGSPLEVDLPPRGCRARVAPVAAVWAAGPLVSSVPDLAAGGGGARVLVLLGGNDGIARFDTDAQRAELEARLPGGGATRVRTIRGGNHSGFASYERASGEGGGGGMNGRRDITLEEQHDEVSRETVGFLLSGKS